MMYLMVLERKTEYFQESKWLVNEDRRKQDDNNLKVFLLLGLTNFRSDTEWLSSSPRSVIFPPLLTKGFFVQGRLVLDAACVLYQDWRLQSWTALCGLIIKAESSDPPLLVEPIIDANHVQLSRGHWTFQAGELGSKSKTVIQVTRIISTGQIKRLAASQAT